MVILYGMAKQQRTTVIKTMNLVINVWLKQHLHYPILFCPLVLYDAHIILM